MQYTKLGDTKILEYNTENNYSNIVDLELLEAEIEFYKIRLQEIEGYKITDPSVDFEPEILGLQSHIERFNFLKTL